MKKFLLSALLMAGLGLANQAKAQCSGGNVAITNFVINPQTGQVFYSFNWEHIQGNASIQVGFLCNGVQVGTSNCIPSLKDSAAGPHTFSGSFLTNCSGIFRVEIRVHTNPSCGNNYCVTAFREISNSPLPVSFKQFSISRNRSMVSLKWETATETNNTGFAVERNLSGSWEQVAFVPTQATNGFSTSALSYQYSDLNNVKGISQYRVRQVDVDGKSKFSETRSVRGDGQTGKTIVYPNPTMDGKVNVIFEDGANNTSRDITVTDMSGRTLKAFRGVTSTTVTIDNLAPGMYSLRILVPATGEQSIEKIVVNKQ